MATIGIDRHASTFPAPSARGVFPPFVAVLHARAIRAIGRLVAVGLLLAISVGAAAGTPAAAGAQSDATPVATDGTAGGALTVRVFDPSLVVERSSATPDAQPAGPPFLPLAGACFGVFPAGETSGRVAAVAGGCSGEDGVATIRGIPDGDFVLVQTTAPAGYRPMTTPLQFAMAESQTYLMTVENVVLAEATFRAIDETGQALPGACVELYEATRGQAGASVARACDADDGADDGVTTLRHLPPGEYVAVEVSAPAGYEPAPEQAFTVTARSGFDFAVMRLPLPEASPATTSLAIYPMAETGELLAGACFSLSGPVTYEPVCDGGEFDAAPLDGQIRIDGLEPGEYAVVETTAPEGVDPAADVSAVAVEGQIAEVVVLHETGAAPGAES